MQHLIQINGIGYLYLTVFFDNEFREPILCPIVRPVVRITQPCPWIFPIKIARYNIRIEPGLILLTDILRKTVCHFRRFNVGRISRTENIFRLCPHRSKIISRIIRAQSDQLFHSHMPVCHIRFVFLIPRFQLTAGKGPYISPFQLYIRTVRIAVRILMKRIKKDSSLLIIDCIWLSLGKTCHRKDFICINNHRILYRLIKKHLKIRFVFRQRGCLFFSLNPYRCLGRHCHCRNHQTAHEQSFPYFVFHIIPSSMFLFFSLHCPFTRHLFLKNAIP